MATLKIITAALFGSLLALTATMSAMAEEPTSVRTMRSISYEQSAEPDETTRTELLEQAEEEQADALVTEGFRPESGPTGLTVDIIYHASDETWIYDASTELISDFNHDGFYHRFSIEIDADTTRVKTWVYAEIYVSYEGGPWNYLASSDDYAIYADSAGDTFVVETELASGFSPGYYDIRIELHDAEYGDWLQSYGPYDDPSLAALPLEDSYYDDPYYVSGYTTEVVVDGRGSMGWMLLAAIPVLTGLGRKLHAKRN